MPRVDGRPVLENGKLGEECEFEFDWTELDDWDIRDEFEARDLGEPPLTAEDLDSDELHDAAEARGFRIVRPDDDPAGYVQAALRDALANPDTPRSIRDLLFHVHGCIIP